MKNISNRFPKTCAMSISSWFCVPEQGMKDFEVLCRASAFLLPAKWGKSKYHILTVSHCVAPWKWPKLYPDEWLQCVNEKHTHYTAEMRYDHGEFMTQVDLKPQMFLHPKRDLAVMHFHDESSALNVLRKLRLEDNLHLRAEDSLPGNFTESLYFHGHEVKTANTNKGGVEVDDRKVVPRYSIGNVMGRTDHQIFCKTDPVLVDGMCGGPVCLEPVVGQVEKDVVCGMVEGIVPPNHTSELLRNAAVFVESGEIRKFLAEIEAGTALPVIGGDALEVVGKDQDPDKMDLKKIL